MNLGVSPSLCRKRARRRNESGSRRSFEHTLRHASRTREITRQPAARIAFCSHSRDDCVIFVHRSGHRSLLVATCARGRHDEHHTTVDRSNHPTVGDAGGNKSRATSSRIRRCRDAPKTDAPSHGYPPTQPVTSGFEVKGADGDLERQTRSGSTVGSRRLRLLWAVGYHQPAKYYVARWQLYRGAGGQQPAARSASGDDATKVIGDWVVVRQRVCRDEPYHGHDRFKYPAEQLGLESIQQQDLSSCRRQANDTSSAILSPWQGRSPSRLLWVMPMRGLGQGTRNDIDGFDRRGHQTGERAQSTSISDIYGGASVDPCVPRTSDGRWSCSTAHRHAVGRCVQSRGLRAGGSGALYPEAESED